jgi:hypothetical protein
VEQLSLRRRLPAVAVLVAGLLVVPAVAGGLVAGSAGALAAGLGAVFTLLVALRAGVGLALRVLPGLVLVMGLAGLAAGTWWWVALLVALAVLAGLGSTRGLLVPAALAGMLAASAPPLGSEENLVVRLAAATLAALYVVAVGRRLGLPAEVPLARTPAGTAVPIAVVLAVAVGIAATVALRWGDAYAYWIPVSVFLLSMPTPGIRLHAAARERLLGTALGLVAGVPLVAVGLPGAVRIPIAVLLLLLVLAVPRPLALNAGMMTALLVMLLDGPTGEVSVGVMRLLDVAIAAALVAAGVAVLTWWVGRQGAAADARAVTEQIVTEQTVSEQTVSEQTVTEQTVTEQTTDSQG